MWIFSSFIYFSIQILPAVHAKITTPLPRAILTQVAPKKQKAVGKTKKAVVLEPWKQEIADYICTKSWDCKTAVAVFYAESGLNPGAVSPTNDHGIAQIHNVKEYDVHKNVDMAYEMYSRRGWQPWAAHNSGAYRKYLNVTSSGSTLK